MRMVALLVSEGVNAFDLASGGEVFAGARMPDGSRCYEVRMCGTDTIATAFDQQCFRLETLWPLEAMAEADTVIVPAAENVLDPGPAVLDAVRAAADRGARVASICLGSFVLAAAGLLDGLRATTHWQYCDALARLYPRVEVDPEVLFVDAGAILTSAGQAAGLDMCLHLVRRDFGSAIAAGTARSMVLPLQRDGGQAQFIDRYVPPEDGSALQPVLDWIEQNLHRPVPLTEIARHAGLSTRTLQRRFEAQLGTTVQRWLLTARIHRARQLLETTGLPIDRVAEEAGFGSVETLRYHFARQLHTTPRDYRRAFGDPGRQS
ncbi:GlxA family transcriptional regulator [Nocardia transvalensis]|uniref:GlxA family transcriptional regulator n=1 Tax=Nocardia transvalensis TaxID=37333 RepID=UPI001895CD5D|nr:helix-turn-helix domain-containing protein [Nocardia transvalensis]MBF6329870.1 helix-turn-helix domain-containing protein [Nocardia transvalensis]